MTIQQYEPPKPDALPVVHSTQVTDLVAWAAQADAAFRYATGIVDTNFCPQQYRGKREEAAAAILAGAELGFSPMASLRTFDSIQGVASPKAITQRAVVQSHGHEMWTVEKSATRCVVQGHRRGSDKVQESVWTIERAELAGFIKKNPNYRTQPESMLLARATAECARMVASDALLGIPYSSEELQDDAALTAPHPDSQRALPRAAGRGSTTVSTADLTGDATTDADVVEAANVAMIDKGQWAQITSLFKAAGVNGPARAGVIDGYVGRAVKGVADLTSDEANGLIERMRTEGPDGIARAAGIEVAEETPEPADPGYTPDPEQDPWAAQADGADQ